MKRRNDSWLLLERHNPTPDACNFSWALLSVAIAVAQCVALRTCALSKCMNRGNFFIPDFPSSMGRASVFGVPRETVKRSMLMKLVGTWVMYNVQSPEVSQSA